MRLRRWRHVSILGLMVAVCGLARVAGEPAPPKAADEEPVTFNRHVALLVFQHCSVCHRPGEVAPFPLLTYADVKKRGRQIQTVTSERFMPPWKSVAGHGKFLGERRLSEAEIDRLARWVKQGMPEGDARYLPAAPKFNDGWTLGPPDL